MHREKTSLQFEYVKIKFGINLVNFTFYDCFRNNEPQSNGFYNTIIIQMYIVWNVTSYMSNVALYIVMCLVVPQSMIHLHTLLECIPSIITNVFLSFVLCIFCIFVIFSIYFVAKLWKMARFATTQKHHCALAQNWIVPIALFQHHGDILTFILFASTSRVSNAFLHNPL